ncbi:MAG: hypothetical protein NTU53_07265 [Planctomycetota bacterium]|nr:hypothetical protein [Planctomycetota bacterium]
MLFPLNSLILAQVTLEDVFKSTQENMTRTPTSSHLTAFSLGAVALAILLIVLQQFHKRSVVLKPINHHGRLLKELAKSLPLKFTELKQLKRLAEQQSYSSPLTLLLCPSLLSKAIESRPPIDRKSLDKLIERISQDPPPAA